MTLKTSTPIIFLLNSIAIVIESIVMRGSEIKAKVNVTFSEVQKIGSLKAVSKFLSPINTGRFSPSKLVKDSTRLARMGPIRNKKKPNAHGSIKIASELKIIIYLKPVLNH